MKNALKNCVMFFGAAIVGVIAIFIFFGAICRAAGARLAIGSVPPNITPGAAAGGSYDFGSSLQNLVSPFTDLQQSQVQQ